MSESTEYEQWADVLQDYDDDVFFPLVPHGGYSPVPENYSNGGTHDQVVQPQTQQASTECHRLQG